MKSLSKATFHLLCCILLLETYQIYKVWVLNENKN